MPQLRRDSRVVVRALLIGTALVTSMASGRARADGHAGEWERVSDKEGIVVERRSVDGSNLKEFLGRGDIVKLPYQLLVPSHRIPDARELGAQPRTA